MAIGLDHLLVPSRDSYAAAKQLAELLDVPWGNSGAGPFVAVYVNDALTLDFDQWESAYWDKDLPQIHYCFCVDEATFDAILGRIRAAGIDFRSRVHGPTDFAIDTDHGGRIAYWNVPDGHQWEMLTLSYARRP